MNPKLIDLFDRVGSTAVQTVMGVTVGSNVATYTGVFDWRASAAAIGVSALGAVVKWLGIYAATTVRTVAPAVEHALDAAPAPVRAAVLPAVEAVESAMGSFTGQLGSPPAAIPVFAPSPSAPVTAATLPQVPAGPAQGAIIPAVPYSEASPHA